MCCAYQRVLHTIINIFVLLNLPFHIAKRYFFSRKSGGSFNLITIISGISLLGYLVGSAALIIVLSVFNGFEQLFMSLYTHFDADIQVTAAAGKTFSEKEVNWHNLQTTEGVEAWSKVLEENVLLKYGNQQCLASVKGVDEKYVSISNLDSSIVAGEMLVQSGDTDYAVVGQGIAYRLSLDPNNVFQPLSLFIPRRDAEGLSNPESAFNRTSLMPSGVFSIQEEVDNKYVIVSLRFLKELLQRDELSALEIRLAPTANADKVKKELQQMLGDRFLVKNRYEQRASFFKVMRSEKTISYVILCFILLIAASNTIGSLYILVMEKKRDLSVMRSMGLTPAQAYRVFMFEGIFIAVTGGVIGIVVGLLLCYLQEQYGFIRLQGSSDFLFSSYPVVVNWKDMVLVFATVMILGVITSLYPAHKAKRSILI